MIRHILLIRWREGITDLRKNEVIKTVKELQTLDCIQNLICGEKMGLVSDSYDFALLVDFTSEKKWKDYQNDPAHIAAAESVRPLIAEFARIQIAI